MQNINLNYKHNFINDEVIIVPRKEPKQSIINQGAILSGMIKNDIVNRADRINNLNRFNDTLKTAIFKSGLRGHKNIEASYKQDQEGPSIKKPIVIHEKNEKFINSPFTYKDYETNIQMSNYFKYSGQRKITKKIKDKVNEVFKIKNEMYYLGAKSEELLGGLEKIANEKNQPTQEKIYDNPLDEDKSRLLIEENNLVETPYKQKQDDRFIYGINLAEVNQKAKESKGFLNIDDDTDFDELDKEKSISDIALNFGQNYSISK